MEIKEVLTNINFTKGRGGSSIKYLVFHYTANDGDTAIANANYFKTVNRNASAHFFVDEKGVIQVVKDSDTAWHCGDTQKYTNGGASQKGIVKNVNSIGIEMCSIKKDGQFAIKKEVQTNAANLGKFLMKKHGIPITNVFRHYDVTGKICPAPFVQDAAQWKQFKELLEEEEEMIVRYERLKDIPNGSGFRDVIEILVKAQIIRGEGSDKTGNNNVLDLSEDQVRSFVILYRGGAFDRKLIAMGMEPSVKD